jgi:thioredoxin-like negative regulator of GroEL
MKAATSIVPPPRPSIYTILQHLLPAYNNIHPPSMSKVTPVTSSAHFRTITSSATFTVVDFYADWCGPCKVISPVFEQLATAESKPGKIVFCKVDVDAQREIAGNYGVSA